jgi:hypothetical protein
VHWPETALHCAEERQTSDPAQSWSVAAKQALPASVHLPAKAHCCAFLQSLSLLATHLPLSAKQLPNVAQAPLKPDGQ